MVRKLANGINGDVFAYRLGEGAVAVKKLRTTVLRHATKAEPNERLAHRGLAAARPPDEDALTEIGVLLYLAKQPDLSPHLIKMCGVFAEGTSCTWLVTEFADGGEFFSVVASRAVSENDVRLYMWQILKAVAYLHRHFIAHRDISLENVLLKDGSVKVMDFGMAVRSHDAYCRPLRFFNPAGKSYYRAPECYVPKTDAVGVLIPMEADTSKSNLTKTTNGYLCQVRLPPVASPGKLCTAEPIGYEAQPADIFAVGACLFILAYRCPPWQKAVLADQYFRFVYENCSAGVDALLNLWKKDLMSPQACEREPIPAHDVAVAQQALLCSEEHVNVATMAGSCTFVDATVG